MISGLEPASVWKYFSEISAIPRMSGHEEKIIDYLESFANERGLKFKKDAAGNVVISKPARPGKESSPCAVLQSHVDMVCEKNEGTDHDFLNDPLDLFEENGFVRASGTSLGADDGMGVGAALALLDSDDVGHGPLECLFTVDEETGLTGANALEEGFVSGRILLNMDSEEEGAVYIGCAGGKTTSIFKSVPERLKSEKQLSYTVKIDGLRGGHSGLAINSGLGNAIILLARFLWVLDDKINFDLAEIRGGEKHNAIPREAMAEICINEEDLPILETKISKYTEIYKNELRKTDEGVKLSLKKNNECMPVLPEKEKSRLLNLLYSFPHGVFAMSPDIKGLVQTSTNMASVSVQKDGIQILTSQRSSVESSIHDVSSKVISHALLADYEYISKDPYPAWTPDPDSPLLKKAVAAHEELFGKKPEIKAVHAGLECGIIGRKYPGMDMISFGPDVYGAHSPDEKVRIVSVGNFWNFLISIVQKI